MMKKKQGEKDPGRSYTTMVMESLREQSGPPEGSKAGSWEEKKKAQQEKNMSDTSTAISRTAVGTAPLPRLLMRTLLNPQPYPDLPFLAFFFSLPFFWAPFFLVFFVFCPCVFDVFLVFFFLVFSCFFQVLGEGG